MFRTKPTNGRQDLQENGPHGRGAPSGDGGVSSTNGHFGKLLAVAMVIGLMASGMVVMLVPQEAGGDGDDLPDLKVEKSGIEFSGEPATGNEVTIEVDVENVGDAEIEHWQITNDDYDQQGPAFSPNGNKIVYESKEDGGPYRDIWVMNKDGSNHSQLNDGSDDSIHPFFTSNSTYIYYSLETPTWDIYRMESNGDNEEEIIGGPGEQSVGDITEDGGEIVYFTSGSDLWIANSDGTNRRQLTTDGKFRNYPSFSKDASMIVYESKEDGGSVTDIWILEKSGSTWNSSCKRTQLTYENYIQEHAYFTPDTNHIIYISQEDGGGVDDIWIMDVDGNNHIQLTNENYRQGGAFMSADGTKIAYCSNEDGGSYIDIWQLNATATATVKFYDGDPENGGTLIGTDDIAIWANATAKAQIKWTPQTGGVHEVYVVVDDVAPGDENASNNIAMASITVEGEKLTLECAPTYRQGDLVTINATHTNGSANITFQVKDPDNDNYVVKTLETDAEGYVQYNFRLRDDVDIGVWTVYATNDKDDANATLTFEVLGPPCIILKLLDVPSNVSRGGKLTVGFTIENTFDTAKTVTLVLQVEDPELTPLEPAIKERTIPAGDVYSMNLSVDIPSDAETGIYAVQGQMLTELPENAGYALDYEDTTVSVN